MLIIIMKAPLATTRAPLRIGCVHLFVYLSVCLSAKMHTQNAIFSKIKQFRTMVSIDDLQEDLHKLFTEPIIGSLKFKWDGDGGHFQKIVVYHTLAADCPILVKFCAGKQFSAEFRNETNPAFHRTYFVFLMQFGLQRSAHFVSSPIQLLTFCKALSVNNETQSKAPILTLHPVESYAP